MTSVSELEQDIADTRSRLHGTIDQIQSRLTVSGIVDEVMGQAGVPRRLDGRSDFVFGLLRRHPVPLMITAAAIGFLIHQANRRAAARSVAGTSLRSTRTAETVDVTYVDPLIRESSAGGHTGRVKVSDPRPGTLDHGSTS